MVCGMQFCNFFVIWYCLVGVAVGQRDRASGDGAGHHGGAKKYKTVGGSRVFFSRI